MLKRRRACGRIAVTEQLQKTCEILEDRRGERQAASEINLTGQEEDV